MEVKLISCTPDAEKTLVYIARVSSNNQNNTEYAKLVKYLIDNNHYSPFEHAFLTVEIKTSRAVAAQILRHRSFTFQEFSQRYADVPEEQPDLLIARKPDVKNRQSSEGEADPKLVEKFLHMQDSIWDHCYGNYKSALAMGVPREQARMLLPLMCPTTIYMSGTLRSWMHYLQQRCDSHTQKEHRDIALKIRTLLADKFPVTWEALGWTEEQLKLTKEVREFNEKIVDMSAKYLKLTDK